MNVLILTPDRVGSTLLQRLLTIYMNMCDFDRPVINLHELTNGIIKYVNARFNREVLGKPSNDTWGYYQTLPEITELLRGTDHYKTSRLAYYHIVNRKDSIQDQLGFYQYLNDNFYIISAQRENLFEYALSWGIHSHSKRLNVYSHSEKIETFYHIYQNRIQIDPENMIKYLNQYRRYLQWIDDHFHVSSYFKYERDMPNIENYILDLPVFNNQPRLDWKATFDMDFRDWNRCHYLLSDISGLGQQVDRPLLEYHGSLNNYELAVQNSSQAVLKTHNAADQQFLLAQHQQYKTAAYAIDELVNDKVLVSTVPIKLQTMLEKKLLVRNFEQCATVYNDWVAQNGIGQPYNAQESAEAIQHELLSWHQPPQLAD